MTTQIPQNDFRRQWQHVSADVLRAVERVGKSARFILGDEVAQFEAELASCWGLRHAVGVANGLDAIEIALRALGVQPGNKVLTTPISAFASTLAIIRAGGVPVFVDVDENGLIDLQQCRDLLGRDTSIRFFVPVHMYGFALDLDELARLQRDFGLRVVEDCAQSITATFRGTASGAVGQIAATSFYPTKNLGALGDAGAVLTNNDELAARAHRLRNTGRSEHHVHAELGLNSRLDELHAAILRDAFLPRVREWTDSRSHVAERYRSGIRHPLIRVPRLAEEMRPAWHLFPIFVEDGKRDALREHLHSLGILSSVHYPLAITDQPALREARFEIAAEPANARRIAASELSLPIHPFLHAREIATVIEACNSWCA